MADAGVEAGVEVVNFGCRLNALEGDGIARAATAAGLERAFIVNTCAVTAEAVRQARQAIRRSRRRDPSLRIVVTGCAAQTEPGTFAAMDEVDLVLGNGEKVSAASWADARHALDFGVSAEQKVRVQDISTVRAATPHLADRFEGHTRAFVEVQNGCDHRCTFCIIPFGRGPSRSVPMGAVVAQVARLVESGHAEVVLTGVDLTAYGADLPGAPTLGRLVRAVLARVPELKRLRLSSIDAVEADRELMRALAEEERLMPHLHLSLQSGDDLILKRMKRRHSRAEALAFIAALRQARPDVVLGADIIAGFPTETEAQARATRDFAEEAGLVFLHAFPFSARPGTAAARMPQLAPALVAERAARLRETGAGLLRRHLSAEVGRRRTVLVEAGGRGHTEHFTPVRLSGAAVRGSLADLRIAGHDGARLIAA
ncbi:tRNA (N(6)-L-threonylcarbamoyladenosine(37)-C(2))-methylthiotransferase MtaB [Xanthobacter sp. 126]|uniref:tRNA (N(6)-L-threonylcarbamoyladenosine(37)-C(2))- methylthiotransferase MtaB n=1 Tax=Xanthobacter sp. 126 TaxID=1131814 RepID=UPI0004A64548|nr:tRNA (N(6)-L-threonylcarbamoyladenosine(37)-C(2))-methylthiotransferase MtaB [Xanthobacter sp. 126]